MRYWYVTAYLKAKRCWDVMVYLKAKRCWDVMALKKSGYVELLCNSRDVRFLKPMDMIIAYGQEMWGLLTPDMYMAKFVTEMYIVICWDVNIVLLLYRDVVHSLSF